MDVSPFYYSIAALERFDGVDYLPSSAYVFSEAILVASPPQQKAKLRGVVDPFNYEIWLVLLPSIVVYNSVKAAVIYLDKKASQLGQRHSSATLSIANW